MLETVLWMTYLNVLLVLGVLLLLGAAVGAYMKVRRQLRESDARLRRALEELQRRRPSTGSS
jgi:hypothetical protein